LGRAALFFDDVSGLSLKERGDLQKFWHSAEYIRRSMRRCNAFCGISHSVRRESSTTASRRPIRIPVVEQQATPRATLVDYSFKLTPR
jgi:hypothetical protein